MSLSTTTLLRLVGAAAALALITAAYSSGSVADHSEAASGTTAQEPSGSETPATPFATFDGATTTLAEFRGEPVVLNFWASWCPSCVAEMSAAFRPVPEDLGGTITFVGMNIQDERALALELLEETAVGWVNAEDPDGALYAELGGLGMPFTVVISADGLVTIRGIPWLAESWGWQWAFPILAAGPALGIAAMVALKRSPQAAELAGGVG